MGRIFADGRGLSVVWAELVTGEGERRKALSFLFLFELTLAGNSPSALNLVLVSALIDPRKSVLSA